MFLLVSFRHVGAHLDELQHGVSIQSSTNLGKTFPRISRIRVISSTQILARVFVYLRPFISQILDFICRMVLSFILIYFGWRDTENQQFLSRLSELVWKLARERSLQLALKRFPSLGPPANGNESNAKKSRFHPNRNLTGTIYHWSVILKSFNVVSNSTKRDANGCFKILLLSSHLLNSPQSFRKSNFGTCAVTGCCSFKSENLK